MTARVTYRNRHRNARAGVLVLACALAACGPAALKQQVEARRLAADLHLQFTKAAEAANRSVMAPDEAGASTAAREAEQASQAAARDYDQLLPILQSLGYSDAVTFLQDFRTQFGEYRKLDQEILPLATENSNLKAQRLSFGTAREAADRFRASLLAAAQTTSGASVCCAEAIARRAGDALYRIQVLEGPHIAEAEDAAMTRMEAEMHTADTDAQQALEELNRTLGSGARDHLQAALAALEQFRNVNKEIVELSRRNSNVRSLALSVGRKRMVTASADDQLRGLEEAIQKYQIRATR